MPDSFESCLFSSTSLSLVLDNLFLGWQTRKGQDIRGRSKTFLPQSNIKQIRKEKGTEGCDEEDGAEESAIGLCNVLCLLKI